MRSRRQCFWALGACLEVLLALFVMPTLGWQWLLGLSSLPLLVFTLICPVSEVTLLVGWAPCIAGTNSRDASCSTEGQLWQLLLQMRDKGFIGGRPEYWEDERIPSEHERLPTHRTLNNAYSTQALNMNLF